MHAKEARVPVETWDGKLDGEVSVLKEHFGETDTLRKE